MGKNLSSTKKSILKEEKKRNLILLFLILSVVILVVGYILLNTFNIDSNLITTIYIVLLILESIFVFSQRNKILYYNMSIAYLKMLNDNLGMIHINQKLFTTSWIEKIEKDGFLKSAENNDYVMYHKFSKKLMFIASKDHTMTVIIIAKHNQIDFYSESIDHDIEKAMMNYKDNRKVRKTIVLQYKKFDSYTPEIKEELDKIINFKNGENYLIHINVGYFTNTNSIYFLRGKKKYPNKYYYYAVSMILYFAGLKDGQNAKGK